MPFDPNKAEILTASALVARPVPTDLFLLGPHFLPRGGNMIVSGSTGIGKSWLVLNLLKALATGSPLFSIGEWPTVKAKSLLLETEVGPTLGKRFEKVFHGHPEALANIDVLSQPEGFSFSYPDCCQWLQEVVRVGRYDVIVLDPIGDLTFHNENDNTDMGRFLASVRDIRGTAASILIHHNKKEPQDTHNWDPLHIDNMRGAGKLGGAVDSILMLSRRPGKLVQAPYDNWALGAAWQKTRHAEVSPDPGQIYFNQSGDGSMVWMPLEAATPKSRRSEGDGGSGGERPASKYASLRLL